MLLRVPFKFKENTFNSLYLDITFPLIRFDYQNPFIHAIMINPETGSTYRITFLSPIPSTKPIPPISLIKRNQKVINIKKKIDTKIVPYIKAQKVSPEDILQTPFLIRMHSNELELFLKIRRLQIINRYIVFNIILVIFHELSRYFNYTPSLPNIALYQYSILEHKVELDFLLYDFDIYTQYIFEDTLMEMLSELDYREIYLLSTETVHDLYFLSYYYFWFYLNYGVEFWSMELIDNKDGLRLKVGGMAWNSIHGWYRRYGYEIWNVFHTYYLNSGIDSKNNKK